jgi:1-deoxy-D-xylulose 5-phosphate reductoisomerase
MVVIAATGHLGEAALSVVVLATSVFNVTGLSVLIGFSSAMETFCGCGPPLPLPPCHRHDAAPLAAES